MSEVAPLQRLPMETNDAAAHVLVAETSYEDINEVEAWNEDEFLDELFDDDSLADAHESAADGLLEEYVRSEAEQQARDELAAKALNLITSAIESPFSDAGRKMELVNQLITRIGHLCDGSEVQKVIDKHTQSNVKRQASKTETETDDEEDPRSPGEKTSLLQLAKGTGGVALKPWLKLQSFSDNLRRLLMPFRW